MSRLGNALEDFRSFKNNPPKKGALSTALQGIKKNVIVLVPVMKQPDKRFHFMTLCLQIAWSAKSSAAFITGAFFSLLSMFAENPGSLLRSLVNDPDIDIQIAEVSDVEDSKMTLATRGRGMDKYEEEITKMIETPPKGRDRPYPYAEGDYLKILPRSTEDLQIAIQTVTAQIWILLTKAVTAIDTARESETRRWIKYEQQRRADADYRLDEGWLNFARVRIASDLAIRRFMVEILIDANKVPSPKARVLELICDIGNYISEAGLAGFHLTIKYGIETRYPALALNELQADLGTMLALMKCYMELGERAPYMVILEDSIQTKFSPGSYPLLWSYAMGVGAMLDRAVNNLNYARNYLEQPFYNLGVGMVERMEGSVNRQVAEELGLTQDQISQIKDLVKQEADYTAANPKQAGRSSIASAKFDPANVEELVPDEDNAPSSSGKPTGDDYDYRPRIENAERSGSFLFNESKDKKITDQEAKMIRDQVAGILKREGKKKKQRPDMPAPAPPQRAEKQAPGSDLSVIDS
ncbi:nucleocapsid protein [Wufeng Rattus nitidus jeilongvirus 1]|uniref:Nucleocapsid n=1 Tax=Wufeng Rattus nitidus jeilongvirus 1 TaxID=2877503 RepID=A0AAE8XRR4_9MONO|nr:nucleocapsid protein [Wufeng Rattus nitidus jeilongvirus 1]